MVNGRRTERVTDAQSKDIRVFVFKKVSKKLIGLLSQPYIMLRKMTASNRVDRLSAEPMHNLI